MSPLIPVVLGGALIAALVGWYLTDYKFSMVRVRNRELADQVAAHEALRNRLASLEALNMVAYEVLFLVDRQHRVLFMNDAAHELFNYPGKGFSEQGESVMAVTRNHELDDIVRDALVDSNEGGGVGGQVAIGGCAYRVRAMTFHSTMGLCVALAMEDISELQRLGRARRDMVANVSHELRTPITSIRLLTDTLRRDFMNGSEEGEALAGKINAEIESLEQMAQELLDLSMIESGRAEIRLIPVELGEIIRTSVSRFSEQADRKSLTIEGQAPPHLAVLADPDQVGRVLNNLLHNAIKFTPAGGIIDIGVTLKDDWVQVSVTDTGPGIPEEEQARVFERFYQADRARRGGGTGLGLAIAKHIVVAHGGEIWAETPPDHTGARICFTLPTAE
jgi:two-component system phosphate regulon sensor histidine kinase PhoR